VDAAVVETSKARLPAEGGSEQPMTVSVPAPTGTRAHRATWSRAQEGETSADFGDLLAWIWRRKALLVGMLAGATALCGAALSQMTPVYTAQGVLLAGAATARISNLQGGISSASAEVDPVKYEDAVEYEIEVLHAPALLGAVADRLSLHLNPEFNRKLRATSIWQKVWTVAQALVVRHLGGKADARSPEERVAERRADVVRSVLIGLSVARRERSGLLEINFTCEDPVLSARIVNTLLDFHIADQVEEKYKGIVKATEWLRQNVASWQERTLESEERIEEFRSRADLLEGEQGVLLLRQISETNAQLSTVRLARAMAVARLEEIEESGPGKMLVGAREISESPVIQDLRKREADLMAKEAEMLTKYGRDHTRVTAVRTELQNLRNEMALEIDRIVEGLKSEVAANRSVERVLAETFERLKRQIAVADMAKVKLQALRRESDANRAILTAFMSRLAETEGQADRSVLQPNASIISRAAVPLQPSYPRPKLYFALTFVLAVATWLLFIAVTEWMRRGFCSGDEVERVTGVPLLGLLPRLRGSGSLARVAGLHPGAVPLPLVASGGRPRVFETSVQWLATSISVLEGEPRSFLLTSAKTAEGKTTTAVSLSRALAHVNGKVVVVDADLCRPGIHAAFKVPASPGLRDLLLGEASLDAVLHKDAGSSVFALPAGTDGQPHNALPWSALEPVIASLRQSFDLIVIDGPPILEAPEARLLSRISDATLLVVRWAKTDRRHVVACLEQIEQAGGRPAGVLLSRVEPRKYACYNHRDSHGLLLDAVGRCTH
jgi:succinoglycan biosynthesis transport protein ExoP